LGAVYAKQESLRREKERLDKRTEELAAENKDVGRRWNEAVSHSRNLEEHIEKLTAQMDKQLGETTLYRLACTALCA
jgi:chromosome segregation ATPase